ncbi:MAG: [FeFe] hydrogenase H-cluster radical SAM maturase HydE [bacterium]|nr:[FeFe] hydrogenase H-cluster radical SAM maturase HydE [bacterium]
MNKQQIIDILNDNSKNQEIFALADKVRHENVGDSVHLRGLIEFSDICRCDCLYCGLRCSNKTADRYRINKDEIVSIARNAVSIGYKTIVLQSGEDLFYNTDTICEIIRKIKSMDVAVTLSIGEKTYDEYKAYKVVGADRYLLRIETTDVNLYKTMHPNVSFENRIKCLENLKSLGYEVGTGCLVGLPNQTVDSLADDILFFKALDADMVGIGPFIPHKQTPLKDSVSGSFDLALKVMALTRIKMPNINIPATTAMEVINPNGRIIALQSGANVVMPNVTPEIYRTKYEIYPGKNNICDELEQARLEIENKIKSIKRAVSQDYGNRRK